MPMLSPASPRKGLFSHWTRSVALTFVLSLMRNAVFALALGGALGG